MKVNEIFYSLQGEGYHTGTPAVFVRLSGCNLKCPFCDTMHHTGNEMSDEEVLARVLRYPSRHIVITGGEPSLQLVSGFVEMLHRNGFFIQVETNGTHQLPDGIDWITCSPKDAPLALNEADELKMVFQGAESESAILATAQQVKARHHFVQPCDTGHARHNADILTSCIAFVKSHPQWRLSLQTHKYTGIK